MPMLCVLTVYIGFIFQILHAHLCAVMNLTKNLMLNVKQTKANDKIIGKTNYIFIFIPVAIDRGLGTSFCFQY